MKTVCIDFDGVIHDYKNPIAGRKMGGLVLNAQESLFWFKKNGYKIIIFTSNSPKVVRDFLKYYNCYFDEVTNQKIQADFYIDDKAIRFTNWQEIIKDIEQKKYD